MITNFLKKHLIVKQILLVSTLRNVWWTVWRIWILMLECKGLTKVILPFYKSPFVSFSLNFPSPLWLQHNVLMIKKKVYNERSHTNLSLWIPCVNVFSFSIKRCHNVLFRLSKHKFGILVQIFSHHIHVYLLNCKFSKCLQTSHRTLWCDTLQQCINQLTPMSDQNRISPYNINTVPQYNTKPLSDKKKRDY